jgi:hypothetical protein
MESGVGQSDADDPLLSIDGEGYARDAGSLTAILVTGEVTPALAQAVLGRLATADFEVEAAGLGEESLVVIVGRRAGVDALRAVESIVEA